MKSYSDIISVRGDDLEAEFFLFDQDGREVTDFSPALVSIQLRREPDGKIFLDLDSGAKGGITFTQSTILMQVTAEQSKELSERYQYDIETQFPDGRVQTIHQGNISFMPDITIP